MNLLPNIYSGYRNHSFHLLFNISPDLFIRIELWGVWWEMVQLDLFMMFFDPCIYFFSFVCWMSIQNKGIFLICSIDNFLQKYDEGICCKWSFIGHKSHHTILWNSWCCIDTKSCSCSRYNRSDSFFSPGSSPVISTFESCFISIEYLSVFSFCLCFDSWSNNLSPFFYSVQVLLVGSKYWFLMSESEYLEYFIYLSFFECFSKLYFDKSSYYRSCPEWWIHAELWYVTWFRDEEFFEFFHLPCCQILGHIFWSSSLFFLSFESTYSFGVKYLHPVWENGFINILYTSHLSLREVAFGYHFHGTDAENWERFTW